MLPEQQIIDEFRERRTRQWLAAIPGVAAFLIAAFAVRQKTDILGIDRMTIAIGPWWLWCCT